MADKILRVLARGTAMVPNYSRSSRMRHGDAHAFIGREWDESLGDGVSTSGGWKPLAEPTVIKQSAHPAAFNEYIHVLRAGDLWPADEATARMSGAKFDPSFGGEYDAPKAEEPKAEDHHAHAEKAGE